jgi:hypothetical protein
MTVSTIMSGYRKTGIFPFDPYAPCVTPPVINKKKHEIKETRKERKDNRTVTILFKEKSNDFIQQKENVELKKKRSTFVPPYGAAITEDNYYEKKKAMEEEKQQKEKKKENTEKEKQKLGKRKKVFNPPFSQSDNSIDESAPNSINKRAKFMNSDEGKNDTVNKKEKKGKGPKLNSERGKGPAKRAKQKTVIEINTECSEDIDTECCSVCGKFQPEALNLDKSIKFVNWGCCTVCSQWVHLKFCTEIETLTGTDDFRCPMCSSEQ